MVKKIHMWPRKLVEWDQATAPVACMQAFIEPNTYIPAEKFLLAEKEVNIPPVAGASAHLGVGVVGTA